MGRYANPAGKGPTFTISVSTLGLGISFSKLREAARYADGTARCEPNGIVPELNSGGMRRASYRFNLITN